MAQGRALWGASAAVFAAAWWILAGGSGWFAPHAHRPGTGGYATSIAFWFVMMIAMMMPAVAPWMAAFGSFAGDAYPGKRRWILLLQFAGGYFAVWLAYSTAAAGLQLALQDMALLRGDLRLGATLGGVLLIGAGLFQLSPLKEACLKHCRNPLTFFLSRWDGGPTGPFRMGARHGIWCVGCCWALMALSFVLGVANLLWMAAITAIVLAEQWAPRRLAVRRGLGIALAMWGAALILS